MFLSMSFSVCYPSVFRIRENGKEGRILLKAGTVKEMQQLQGQVPAEIYPAALRIVTILDDTYGADRDVDNNDGGFVLIAENIQDITDIDQRYVSLNGNRHEIVDVVKCENKTYINAFFLCNNEFGINIFMPMNIAPHALLGELPQNVR